MKNLMTMAVLAFVMSGCAGPWRMGIVEEVRFKERDVAWGVWQKKKHKEIPCAAAVIALTCGGKLLVTTCMDEDMWILYKKGDTVKARHLHNGNWELVGYAPCEKVQP